MDDTHTHKHHGHMQKKNVTTAAVHARNELRLSDATCLFDGSGQHQVSLGQQRRYPALRAHPRRPPCVSTGRGVEEGGVPQEK